MLTILVQVDITSTQEKIRETNPLEQNHLQHGPSSAPPTEHGVFDATVLGARVRYPPSQANSAAATCSHTAKDPRTGPSFHPRRCPIRADGELCLSHTHHPGENVRQLDLPAERICLAGQALIKKWSESRYGPVSANGCNLDQISSLMVYRSAIASGSTGRHATERQSCVGIYPTDRLTYHPWLFDVLAGASWSIPT